jgi:hypothetical protein
MNIERCKALFPNIPIILITNREFNLKKIKGIEIYIYNQSPEWRKLDTYLSHPKDFRENFWLASLARFLALEEYLAHHPGEILHLESDVILSKDFPFDKFSKLEKPIAYPLISSSLGVASTLYIRNHETAKLLVSLSMEMASNDSKTTDMLVLRSFYNSHPEKTQLLPIGPSGGNAYSTFGESTILAEIKSAILIFDGCFDGADIGYYLFGVDPRNARGKKYLRKPLENTFLIIREITIEYSDSRDFLNIRPNRFEPSIPVYSLHIHSKNCKLFQITNLNQLFKVAVRDYLLPESIEFVPRVFLSSIIKALLRRTSKNKGREVVRIVLRGLANFFKRGSKK